MISPGESLFLAICKAESTDKAVAGLRDGQLRTLIDWLDGQGRSSEVGELVWTECAVEATDRFMKGTSDE